MSTRTKFPQVAATLTRRSTFSRHTCSSRSIPNCVSLIETFAFSFAAWRASSARTYSSSDAVASAAAGRPAASTTDRVASAGLVGVEAGVASALVLVSDPVQHFAATPDPTGVHFLDRDFTDHDTTDHATLSVLASAGTTAI